MSTLLTIIYLIGTVYHGILTYYAPNVMDEVYNNRLAYKQITACPECVGNVAVINCAELNDLVYLFIPQHGLFGPFLVIDCANAKHVKNLRQKNRVAEIDYSFADQLNMRGPLDNVTVFVVDR